jgi:hypothetical protein
MRNKTTLIATMIALGGCGALEPGSTPDDAIEVTEQKAAINNPWGSTVQVRAMFGRTFGQHYLVFQRQDTWACLWFSGFGGTAMNQDVVIGLSEHADLGMVASAGGDTLVCDGTHYFFYAPNFNGTAGGQPRTWSVSFAAGDGNDTLYCSGLGFCYGGNGDDLIIARQAEPVAPYLQLYGEAGRDKLLVQGNWPVSLFGGSGQDCLGPTHPNAVTAYNCAEANTTADPEWDASAGWIGSWCNQLTTDTCASW